MGRRGFTLIELLVVIAIIGILASVVLVSLSSARAKARDAQRMSDLKQITTALELYNASNGAYPTSGGLLDCNVTGNWFPQISEGLPNPPRDPRNTICIVPYSSASTYLNEPSTGYYYWSNGSQYQLMSRLEDNNNPNTIQNNQKRDCNGVLYTAAPNNYHPRLFLLHSC